MRFKKQKKWWKSKTSKKKFLIETTIYLYDNIVKNI